MTSKERAAVIHALNEICQTCLKGIDAAKRLDPDGVNKALGTVMDACRRIDVTVNTAD